MAKINRRDFLAGTALVAAGWATRGLIAADQAIEQSPDRRSDPDFVEHSIREISDENLFRALDLSRPELAGVRAAVIPKDYSAAYRAWGEYWQSVAPTRGKFMGDGDVLGLVLLMSRQQAVKSLEPRRDQILAAAEPILTHKINGWGNVTIQHGPVVNFDADYGDSGKYGFNYWGWSWKLIRAYLLTLDVKYLNCFETLFNQWYEQRNHIHNSIPDIDVIYYELGLGLRCRPFLEFYCSAKPQTATHEHMLKTMLGSARWLYEEEKRKYRGGNWQIMGSYGLAWVGAQLSEFKGASDWVRLGSDRIAQHTEKDFFSDGCHSERVPSSYMLVAYRDPRNLTVLLSDRAEFSEMTKDIRPRLKRTLEWYFQMLPPDRIIPAINDGSRVAMPQALINDARQMFGMDAQVRSESICLPDSGFTAMRTDASPDALYMLINHGPSGGGHSHADSLDFELHAYGQAMAIDSGIGYTYDDPHHHSWYIRTRAHNGIMIDGDDLNRKEAQGRDLVWSTLKTFDFFAASHHGYLASKGIIHRRHVAFAKPLYWIVYDVIDSQSDQPHTVSWNLHPTSSNLIVRKCLDWKRGESKGPASVRGIRGFEGKDYADIPWIWFERSIDPHEQATIGVLMFPAKDENQQAEIEVVKQDKSAAHFRVRHPAGTDDVLFGAIDSGEIHFNGAAAVIRGDGFAAAKTLTLSAGKKSLVESSDPRDVEGNF